MKPALLSLALAAVLATAPASAQTGGGAPPPPSPGTSANFLSLGDLPYTNVPGFEPRSRACFNGRMVVGANRIGDRIVYIEAKGAGIFRLEMPDGCGALDGAEKLTVQSDGHDAVCVNRGATLVVRTASGPKRCAVGQVSRLTRTELAELKTRSR